MSTSSPTFGIRVNSMKGEGPPMALNRTKIYLLLAKQAPLPFAHWHQCATELVPSVLRLGVNVTARLA
jgi:hypothetical protein